MSDAGRLYNRRREKEMTRCWKVRDKERERDELMNIVKVIEQKRRERGDDRMLGGYRIEEE